ncbi:MAG: non-canonical purine NTP pyrophosphatase [Planctomycetota bacterium]
MNAPLIVFGTRNRKKGLELAEVFVPLGVECRVLADYPSAIEVEESGTTFADNARLKAEQQSRHLGLWVLGEDSGLEVTAIGGAPGVFSARYSGPNATDASNNALLLEKLHGLPLEKRGARYVCHMALSDPQGNIRAESEGDCRGRILAQQRGVNGFGYDPMFEIIEYHRTFGELSPAVKRCLSHRARAARMLIPQIRGLLQSGALR